MQTARSSGTLLELVDRLFEYPAITVSQAASRLNVTYPSAQKAVERLTSLGMLEETTGRQRNKVYTAPEIIRIVEAEKAG